MIANIPFKTNVLLTLFLESLGHAAPAAEAPQQSFNTLELLFSASPVVQLVLILLLFFSVLSWAIILGKWGTFRSCIGETELFLDIFWSGKNLDFIFTEAKRYSGSPVSRVFQAGYVELQKLLDKDKSKSPGTAEAAKIVPAESAIQNLERALNKAGRNEALKLERSLGFLATTGSTAPFIGLFGTVWGIMGAFRNIGMQGGASLATVAPGIAEALIATAIGLAAAIPAVMGYNYYIQKVRLLRTQMENFAGDFLNIVRRNFLTS